ncbi:major facilitator superfamily domain containing 12 [Nesidiocoris tenuis]|uniref:Major facilitator superfamily domain containing 12 n=1 Tax=Nesidiocoris tenuis TaxID=355587 RepID=A0ABN7AGJ3_9HEMI|nr:major facilitator superfamily domain containing 12 [Nesidiocoris tenuis]
MVVYLNETVLSNKETIATIPLTMFTSAAVTSVFINRIFRVNNQKITFGIGWIASIIGCIIIFARTGRNDDVGDLYAASSLFGIGSAMTLVVSMSFAANIASTEGTEGFVYSSVTFADKAINAMAIVLIEYLKCDDPAMCMSYYKNVMVYFNSAMVTIGLLLVCFVPIDVASID